MIKKSILMMGVIVFVVPAPAFAQENIADTAQEENSNPVSFSLLFSPAEKALIEAARAGVTTGTAILDAPNTKTDSSTTAVPQKRTIRLGGVFYRDEKDWIVWLNGKKITRDTLLPEIVGISVEQDIVSLKWFDAVLNKVINIKMRPHQVYDIGAGVLLPG